MKKAIALLLILLCVFSMAACQKTPESPVVVGKDNDKMIETAGSLEDKSLTIREQVSAPESVKMNFKDQSGKIKFSVDAEVIVPDAEASKIIRVTAHEITQEEVDRWTEVLFADETLYTLESFDQLTKGKITEELLKLKKQLAVLGEFEGETVTAVEIPANDADGESEEATVKEYTKADQLREAIAGYEELLKSAPETPEMTETTNKLQSVNDASVVQFAVPADDNSAVRGFSAANWGYAHPIIYTDRGESQFVGNSYIVSLEEMDLRYRHSVYHALDAVILTVTVELEAGEQEAIQAAMDDFITRRKTKQPLEFPSAGSVFKRPEGYFAGALVEQCGLKGKTIGGAQVSEKHAGFIINIGGATCQDVLDLVAFIQKTVLEETGVALECEIRPVS